MTTWITVTDYTLDVRRGTQRRPPTRFDLVAKDGNGNAYEIRIGDPGDRPELAEKILKLLSEIWPVSSFQIEANNRRVITNVKS